MKVCIVGGVAGGATAAARLRRLSEDCEIIIFERTAHVSYANCGLPYYIGGEIEDKDELTLHTPDSFKDWFSIDVRTNSEVTAVYPETKIIEVKNLKDGRCLYRVIRQVNPITRGKSGSSKGIRTGLSKYIHRQNR